MKSNVTITVEGLEKLKAALQSQDVPQPYYAWLPGMKSPMKVDSPQFKKWWRENVTDENQEVTE